MADSLLQAREQKLTTILESAAAGIISLMPDCSISFFNGRICDMFGYCAEELTLLSYDALVVAEQRPDAYCCLKKLIDGDIDAITTERHYQRKDGSTFWGYLNAQRIQEAGGVTAMLGTITDISELKEAETALLKSSEQLRLAMEASADGIWDWDVSSGQLYWSPRCFTMLGYDANEFPVTLAAWQNLLHPSDCTHTLDGIHEQLARSDHSFRVEFRIACKGGGWRWILGRGKAVARDDHGVATRIVGTFSDVERRKQEELILQFQLIIREMVYDNNDDQFFQYMLDTAEQLTNSSIGFYHIVDDDQQNLTLQAWSTNTLTSMCTAAAKWSHYPIQHAGVWVECFHKKEPVIHNDYQSLSGRQGYPEGHAAISRELTLPLLVEGKVVAIAGVGNKPTPYTEEDLEALQRLVHFAYDVVERKKAVALMRESEMRYALTLEAINDGLWDWDAVSGVTYFSPVYYSMLGYEDGEFEASFESWRDLVHPDDVESAVQKLFQGVETDGSLSIDMRLRMKSGRWLWVCSRGKAIAWHANGKVKRIVGTLADISARKAAEEQVARIEKQFQQTQKLESLGVLAGGIAHDFNNILTIILGHCYITRESIESGMSPTEHVLQIEAAANRAADLCRQMLTYAGKSHLVQSRVNLWLQIDEIVRMLQSAIKKNVVINLDLKRNVPAIVGDESQIQQIVMNLVINSAEAIGDHHGSIYIALRKVVLETGDEEMDFVGKAIPAGEYARLEVTDNGCGMDEETQKRVFEPFFTTKFTGRGLGMSAILGIINSHGGAIQLESRTGEGTTFTVYFPLPGVEEAVTDQLPGEDAVAEGGVGATVLLVDDEHAMRVVGAAMLRSMGYTPLLAGEGTAALEEMDSHPERIDLVILDVNMPGMGGIATYHELRSRYPQLPIIMISGYAVEGLPPDILADTLVAAIQKPFKPEQLQNVIESLLSERR